MKLSDIKKVLNAETIQLSKSLGQNFLHDSNQLRRIVAAAEITLGQRVLEIGPGLGALTQHLLECGADILAIEKDKRLFDLLASRYGGQQRLTLLQADALKYLRQTPADWTDWKVVANLPYSVASPLLVELTQAASPPERLVVTLQLEVAQRTVALAGERDYGLLSLLVQLRYKAGGLFRIPPACFFPAPSVDSACVTLFRRPEAPLSQAEANTFKRIVKRGFSQRRKMMLKLLKADWPPELLEIGFGQAGVSAQARAETVTLDQFIVLARLLAHH
jgi:16S rRNA (adenine1518-N6/adenine1519-N6)-dimethyltransferase